MLVILGEVELRGGLISFASYSKSGLGDHGSQGLDDFITSHKCTSICTAMNLCSMSDLQATMSKLQDLDVL